MSRPAPSSPPDAPAVSVSVVIPCFNSSAFLAQTVQSVLAQTLRDFEIVFVDDGSSDDTREVIRRLVDASAERRLRLVCQANAGVAAARNRGIGAALGRYILPLDADDLIAPTMLEECAAILDAEPDIALVYPDRQDFGDIERVWAAGSYDLQHLKYFNQFAYCALFRKAMWADLGGYRANVSGFDDWDFWLAAAARGYGGRHVAKPFLKHRRHRQSHLWRILDQYERLHAQIMLNNRDVYSGSEVATAERFLATGEIQPLLRSAKLVFLGRYYAGYDVTEK
ncbi:MAG: glycosyltransferase [Betaproteobacteria bacterium]|nr:glycosyltransferase [Betaproteobacteria bacterium]